MFTTSLLQLCALWHNLEDSIIDSTIDQWCKLLTVCVKAKVGHFEHQLKLVVLILVVQVREKEVLK